jgi:hypothetical protein
MTGPTRRSRARGGRSARLTVWLSEGERAAIGEAAGRDGMAPGAWLGEVGVRAARGAGAGGGLAGASEVVAALFAVRQELAEVRRVLRNVGGNLNDVARHANAESVLRADTGKVQALVGRVVQRVDVTVRQVSGQVAGVLGHRAPAGNRVPVRAVAAGAVSDTARPGADTAGSGPDSSGPDSRGPDSSGPDTAGADMTAVADTRSDRRGVDPHWADLESEGGHDRGRGGSL